MELFSLVAKLTLDSKEFESALDTARSNANSLQDFESTLTLDDEDFETKIENANDSDVDDKSAELTLEDEDFESDIENAQSEEVDDKETTLTLDKSPFEDSLDEADDSAEGFSFSISRVFDAIRGMIEESGVAQSIKNIVSALGEAVDLARTVGDEIDKSSQALGLSTDAYQEWKYALDINGASVSNLNRGIMTFRKLIGGQDVSKDAQNAFDKLGISAQKANGELKTTEELLEETVYALADYEGADRESLVQAIFGGNGRQLNAMFNSTSKDIKDLRNEAHELGFVMTEQEVKNAASYNDAVTRFHDEVEALKTALVTDLLPVLTDVLDKITRIIAFFNPRTWGHSLSDEFRESDEALANELAGIEATAGSAEKLVDKLYGMGDVSKMTAEQYAEWRTTAELLIEKIPELSSIINLETGEITANSDEVKENIKQWKLRAIEIAKSNALQTKREALAKREYDLLDKRAELIRMEDQREQEQIKNVEKRNKILEEYGMKERIDINGDVNEQVKTIMDKYSGDEYEAFQLAFGVAGSTGELDLAIMKQKEDIQNLEDEVAKGYEDLATYEDAIVRVVDGEKEAADAATESVNALNEALQNLPDSKIIGIHYVGGETFYKHAKGDWSVPYDNYPALLHRNERILTASQARRMDSGSGFNSGEMYDVVSRAIRAGMNGVNVNSYLNGRDITDDVNRNQARALKARRFAP